MNSSAGLADGSMIWQAVFVSFAVILVLFELIRGWRLGLMRQLTRIAAIIAAYGAGMFGGWLLLPIGRTFLRIPDPVIVMLAGAVLALLIYSVVSSLGTIFFKRTAQHNSLPVRMLSGASGATVGLFLGLFFVWLTVVGIRSLGAIADGNVSQPLQPARSSPQAVRVTLSSDSESARPEPTEMMALLARLKNSIEQGSVGDVVKRTDVTPARTYELLAKVGKLLANPENAERFLSFPGAHELSENPKIVALRNDPEISDLIASRRLFALLQNEKVLDAANDPKLVSQIKQFDLQRALDYALGQRAAASRASGL